jgi:hypothetical protein
MTLNISSPFSGYKTFRKNAVQSFEIFNDPRIFVRIELPDDTGRASGKFRWIRKLVIRDNSLYGEFYVKDKKEGFTQHYVVKLARLRTEEASV